MDKLTAMRCFIAVADAGSFSAAARQLGRSKAGISKHVAELEAELGVQLLVRTTRRVRLTDAGRGYRDRSLQLLGDLDALEGALKQREDTLDGTLRVAAPVTLAELHLTRLVDAFMRAHPALEIELMLTDGFVDLVQQAADVAIRVGILHDSSLVARRLATSRIVCCAAPAYLERHGRPDSAAAISNHALVLDTNFRQPALWRFADGEHHITVRVRGRIRVNSAVFVREQLLAGAGIGLVPEFVVAPALASGALEDLGLTCEPRELGIHALYPQRRHVSRRVRTFVDFLAARLTRELAPG